MKAALGFLFFFLISAAPILAPPLAASGEQADATAVISGLARDYQAQLEVTPKSGQLALSLDTSAQSWAAAAGAWARAAGDEGLTQRLGRARTVFQQNQAADRAAKSGLAGLKFLYQATGGLAFGLAQAAKNDTAIELVRNTEDRIMAVVGESQSGPPVLAALSGGIMTMLAVIAGRVDTQGTMAEALESEFERRRSVANNISRLSSLEAEEKFMLLFNNHIHGSISMCQVIALAAAPDRRDALLEIEQELVKYKDSDLEAQVLAGARALAETGFIAAPLVVSGP